MWTEIQLSIYYVLKGYVLFVYRSVNNVSVCSGRDKATVLLAKSTIKYYYLEKKVSYRHLFYLADKYVDKATGTFLERHVRVNHEYESAGRFVED